MTALWYQAGVAGCDAFLDAIDTQLVAQGMTKFEMNGAAGAPAINASLGKERVYRINGTATDPAKSYIALARMTNTTTGILFWTAAATKGFPVSGAVANPDLAIAVTNVVLNSNILTFTTGAAHGFIVGDKVVYAGGSNLYSSTTTTLGAATATGNVGMTIATVPDTTHFTVAITGSNQVASSGGYVMAVGFPAGERFIGANSNGFRINVSDAAMTIYAYIDELRMAVMVVQGAVFHVFYLGECGRKHVRDDQADRAFVSGGATGTGAVTVTLSRSCTNMLAGQYVTFLHPNQETSERVLVSTKPAANQIGVTLANSYPVGAIIGEDPCPVLLIAAAGSTGQQALSSRSVRASTYVDGSKGASPSGNTQTYSVATWEAGGNAVVSPDSLSQYGIRDLVLYRTSTPKHVRGPLVGFCAIGSGGNDLDLAYDGAQVAANCYKYFATVTADGSYSLGIGPGAT